MDKEVTRLHKVSEINGNRLENIEDELTQIKDTLLLIVPIVKVLSDSVGDLIMVETTNKDGEVEEISLSKAITLEQSKFRSYINDEHKHD